MNLERSVAATKTGGDRGKIIWPHMNLARRSRTGITHSGALIHIRVNPCPSVADYEMAQLTSPLGRKELATDARGWTQIKTTPEIVAARDDLDIRIADKRG